MELVELIEECEIMRVGANISTTTLTAAGRSRNTSAGCGCMYRGDLPD